MIYGLKKVLRYALGKDIAGREIAVRRDDTFLVSYPRSGNTWTRFLIANLLYPGQSISFANIEHLIPDAEAQCSRYMKRIPSPRIIKSHEYFDHRYPRVIYIVRDPRDVALSYYNFERKYRHIGDDYPLINYVHDFVQGRLSSADWGTWAENVGSWLLREGRSDFLLLRYEDMMSDPAGELSKVAEFFGRQATPELLAMAIERSSAQRMRELERTEGSEWITTKGKRTDIPFVGAASSGGWQSRLPAESIAEIESAWGGLMQRLGYAPSVALTPESAGNGARHR